MKPRILLIGLDAATFDLIEPWCSDNQLPALARLMQEGSWARFLSTPNMHSASAWTSILTGLNPGRHGLFVFSDRDFTTGRPVFFTGGDRTGDTIAAVLARSSLASGFLNVPMSYPARSMSSSFTVSGLDAPSLSVDAFEPPALKEELFGRFPDYSYTPPGLGHLMKKGRINDAVDSWVKLTEVQAAAALYLLETRPADFFMTVFTASDWGGHNLWKYLRGESVHPRAAEAANPLLRIYKALDRAVDLLLQAAGDDAQVYVISDHGMGRHSGASYQLAGWLESHGFMKRAEGAGNSTTTLSKKVAAAARRAGQSLPASVKERLKAKMGDRIRRIQAADKDSFYSSIDWSGTCAYTEPGRHVININLRDRNFAGIVPKTDYDHTCSSIIEQLLKWADPEGRNVVDRVSRREEVYSGPFVEQASDLYVHWNPNVDLGKPPAEVRARGYWWSGDHQPQGILICRGPGIKRQAVLKNASVCDLLPTIAHLAGLAVPAGLDGRVIEELADDATRRPVQFEQPSAKGKGQPADVTESEKAMIEEKLRELGYL